MDDAAVAIRLAEDERIYASPGERAPLDADVPAPSPGVSRRGPALRAAWMARGAWTSVSGSMSDSYLGAGYSALRRP
jgi:hypothetical protein